MTGKSIGVVHVLLALAASFAACEFPLRPAVDVGSDVETGPETDPNNETPAYALCATPNPLAFGVVTLGDSKILPLTMTNCGRNTLQLTATSFSAGTVVFSMVREALPVTLEPGAATQLDVRFAPAAPVAADRQFHAILQNHWTADGEQSGSMDVELSGSAGNDPDICLTFDHELQDDPEVGHRVGILSVPAPAASGALVPALTIQNNCAGAVIFDASPDAFFPSCTEEWPNPAFWADYCRFFDEVGGDPPRAGERLQYIKPGETMAIGYRFTTLPYASGGHPGTPFDLVFFLYGASEAEAPTEVASFVVTSVIR